MLISLWGAALTPALAAGPSKTVTGLVTDGGYGYGNYLYQWRIGQDTNDCRMMGSGINLPALPPFNTYSNFGTWDVAVLSDRRIAVVYQRTDGPTVYEVAIMTPQYDAGLNLTNVRVDATIRSASPSHVWDGIRIAPLPKTGFVTGGYQLPSAHLEIYVLSGSNTWTLTSVPSGSEIHDLAGLLSADGTTSVTGDYSRHAFKRNASGMSIEYLSTNGTGKVWAYDNQSDGEGLRHPLLRNGWVNTGQQSQGAPSYVSDGTQTSGGPYNGPVGRILNSDGSDIYDLPWACLDDGRVIAFWPGAQGESTRIRFRAFTLIQDPANQPAGSIGATGDDFTITIPGTSPRGMRIAGDYMVPPPPRGTVVSLR